jgi:hypothetical protein
MNNSNNSTRNSNSSGNNSSMANMANNYSGNNVASRKNRKNRNNMTRRQSGGKRVSAVGSRIQVMHGTADHTAGGLKKGDLMMHKGRIVSRKAHAAGKRAIQRLRAAGYIAKKGHFKLFTKKR